MSEQQNVALIQAIYDAFGRGEVQTILDNLTPDVDWTMEGPASVPYFGTRTGHEGAQAFFSAIGGTQRDQKLTIDEYVAQGDKVATFGRYSSTVTATGKSAEGPIAHLFTIRDGKVSRWIGLGDTAAVADSYAGGAAGSGAAAA